MLLIIKINNHVYCIGLKGSQVRGFQMMTVVHPCCELLILVFLHLSEHRWKKRQLAVPPMQQATNKRQHALKQGTTDQFITARRTTYTENTYFLSYIILNSIFQFYLQVFVSFFWLSLLLLFGLICS